MGSTVVEALYQYKVDLPNGTKGTVSPGDKFTLIKKSNSDWWYVQFQRDSGISVYLPATYLKELNERTVDIDVTPPATTSPHPNQHQGGPEENGHARNDHNTRNDHDARDHNSLEVLELAIKRRGSAPPGSSFKKGAVPRFHHEPGPIAEESAPNVKENKPTRPSQLNFLEEPQKPQRVSPQSPTPDSGGVASVDRTVSDGWKTLTDKNGRKYYHNHTTGQTQWEPPTTTGHSSKPKITTVKSPGSTRRGSEGSVQKVPPGWREEKGSNGERVYIHESTKAKWFSNVDTKGEGRVYYYSSDNPGDTRWQLPEELDKVGPSPGSGNAGNILRLKPNRPTSMYTPGRRYQPNFPADSNLVMEAVAEGGQSIPPPPLSILNSPSSPIRVLPQLPNVTNRRYSDSVEDISPEAIPLEKEGILSKLQLTENGKRVKQKWMPCYTTLNGSKLSFYRDIKNFEKGAARTSPTGPPDSTFELYGAELKWPKNERSKHGRKYAFELSLPSNEILVQGETEEDCLQWFQAIYNGICALGPNPRAFQQPNSKDNMFAESPDGSKNRSIPKSPTRENLAESDISKSVSKSKIRDKLKSFITKRPNPEYLKEKGILKEENVFGKRLIEVCRKDRCQVPRFILLCIEAIEQRGLDVDGIYRVSGNLSSIQKLRFQIDQEKPIDLNSPPWNDIHVIAGALKLFFRELPEPLFTFDAYDRFIQCAGEKNPKQRSRKVRDILKTLPAEHRDTLTVLTAHLVKVVEHGDQNRMKAQNVAIVFGPTLMWPREESFNIATNMIFQNRIMEHILTDYKLIFER